MSNLHIVAVSDTHFGLLVGKNRLDRLVADIHRLNPDIILWPGDILDENVGTFLDNDMDKALQRIKPPLGMYACLGSHEYIWGYPNKAISALSKAGITVLQDQVIKVANSFYLAGRDDFFRMRLTDCPRKNLTNILEECDFSLPIILLDHYPARLAEALENGVDLQLSGHTHSGQLFPLNLITRFLFELDAGYRRTGSFHVIVSSGYGTWLLPLRVGTTAEILSIQVAFLNPRRD